MRNSRRMGASSSMIKTFCMVLLSPLLEASRGRRRILGSCRTFRCFGATATVQKFAQFPHQDFLRKGFTKQVSTGFKNSVTGNKTIRVTGHIKDFHGRMSKGQALRQDSAVYSGHHHIGEKQMNRARKFRGYALSFRSVRGCQYLISVFL